MTTATTAPPRIMLQQQQRVVDVSPPRRRRRQLQRAQNSALCFLYCLLAAALPGERAVSERVGRLLMHRVREWSAP